MIDLIIVDDEPIIGEGLMFTVSNHYGENIRSRVFTSSAAAAEYCKNHPVDIVLTDINIPQLSGLEMAAKIQQVKPNVQIIFLTGYADFDYAYTAIQMTNTQFILKIEPDAKLIAAIDKAIAACSALSEEQKFQDPEGMDESEELEGMSQQLIEKLESYICGHLSSDLSLNTLADILHFNPSYLSRFYKKYRGKTISDYIQEVKLKKSKEMLMQGDCRIKDIAATLGFESSSYFGLFFKKQTGMSPRKYRIKNLIEHP